MVNMLDLVPFVNNRFLAWPMSCVNVFRSTGRPESQGSLSTPAAGSEAKATSS